MSSDSIIRLARRVLDVEAKSILSLSDRVGDDFVRAVGMIKESKGKLVATGVGKSGQIARKLASTFSSTGTSAVYLHPSEGAHGDLGMISNGDIVLALSYGGESAELTQILNFCSRRGVPLIAMTGKKDSALAKAAQAVLDVNVPKEACPLNLAPTASTTATLALGDALAMAVLEEKGFSAENFAEYHPGGSLGARLLTRVKDLMHRGEAMPVVTEQTPLKDVFSIMTHREVRGVAGVVDGKGDLIGVVTDGDIRRRLEKNADPFQGTAKDLMNPNPRTIDQNELAEKALYLMEQFKIQLLFVFDAASASPKKPVGVLNYQDLFRAKIR